MRKPREAGSFAGLVFLDTAGGPVFFTKSK
jgi:hypothetical protein